MKELLLEEKPLKIIQSLQNDFLRLIAKYFQQSNLGFTKLCSLWQQEHLNYLHVLCPEKFPYQGYLQVVYHVLLRWLFVDYSQHNLYQFPNLSAIVDKALRLLVGNIPILSQ